jgi:hypothetical protein
MVMGDKGVGEKGAIDKEVVMKFVGRQYRPGQ